MEQTLAAFTWPRKAPLSTTLFRLNQVMPLASLCLLPIMALMTQHALSQEQLAVVRSSARRLAVIAGAGTGKTHTLAALARSRPNERILYATFSKAAQTDASQRLPPNVQARTLSSLAYATHGRPYRTAGKLSALVRAASVAHLFKCADPNLSLLRSRFALDGVREFCQQTSSTPLPSASLCLSASQSGVSDSILHSDITTLWRHMVDIHDLTTPVTHDCYFKAWALAGAPGLESVADRYLIDEAQDNTCVADLLFSQLTKPVAYVGDPSQSIYAFRGAVDSLTSFHADESLALTTSFRFGPNIASLANQLLTHFKAKPLRVVGSGGDDAICDVQADLPFTVIARTNAGIFSCASAMLDAGHHITLIGGVDAYSLGRLLDLFNVASGNPRAAADPLIRSLASIEAVESYAKLTADHELKAAIRVVKQAGTDLPSLVRRIRTASVEPPSASRTSVTLCTAHKAKGLEFAQVLMADDFPTIYLADGNLVPPARAHQQEVNLLYVALTRACTILRPTDSLLRLLAATASTGLPPTRAPAAFAA